MNFLEEILQQCARANPSPWYPSAYAQTTGIPRDSLDPYLDQLRMGGLIRLTEWMQGLGQGYLLTPEGTQVLQNPRQLARVLEGQLPVAKDTAAPLVFTNRTPAWYRRQAIQEVLQAPTFVPTVTYTLIIINALFFVAGLVYAIKNQVPTDEYLWGKNTRAVTKVYEAMGFLYGPNVYLDHEWWRLLTACFGHIGLLHLGVNMYFLYAIGPLLERLWGRWRFTALYFIAGFGGSCGMMIENPLAGGAGASGALWGLLCGFLGWIYLNRAVLDPDTMATWRRRLFTLIVLNLVITFVVPGISKGAHLGGGIVGLLTVIPLDLIRFTHGVRRLLAWAGLAAIPLACLGLLAVSLSETGDLIRFDQTSKDVVQFYNEEALPIIEQGRFGRDPAKVEKIIDGLAERQARMEQMVSRLEKTHFWWNPILDDVRKRAIVETERFIKAYAESRQKLQ